ncbi:Uncharacterized protein CFAM422_004402 [Trichoderma lentiforme]|uniref:HD domain-containing protein n=1 Tax=Trichoderma lentiforme TaxID=1567552 RepID=A0A9P4XIF4_9HYPO|nr:Uncharacterized protein CFAM422_004402 [Trichoderma lentiforme]
MLSAEQVAFFKANGYLIVRDILNDAETAEVQKWAQEVHDWMPTADSQFMPYEEINSRGETVLCRTENYADSHEGFNGLLRGERLLGILEELSGEPMYLFKEKINYKLAGSGGFAPHIDAVAYNHIKDVKHLTILLAVDKSTLNNGGLEVVDASHNMDIPLNVEDHCIADEWVDSHEWKPVELEPGQLLIFTSYLAHRSGPNHSNENRKALYATYNRASEGDLHQDYYELRKKEWPATHMRKEGETYEDGALRYAFALLPVVTFIKMAIPATLEPEAVTSYIISILQASDYTPYIGEPISQLQHSLQCAALAAEASPAVDEATQVAALLHDVGQFAPADDLIASASLPIQNLGDAPATQSVGRVGHETLGARLLLSLGFSDKVARLVESHVAAKRYLCAVDASYNDFLSEASKKSLFYQGGPMSAEEVKEFNSGPWCQEMCQLRKWDDEAKVEGLVVRDLESWREAIQRQIAPR